MVKNLNELIEFFNDFERIEKKIKVICGQFMWTDANEVHSLEFERVDNEIVANWMEYFRCNYEPHTRKFPIDWLLKSNNDVCNLVIDILEQERKKKDEEEKKKQAQMQKRQDDEDYRTYIRLKEKFGGNKNNG